MNLNNISTAVGIFVSIAIIINTFSKFEKHNKLIEAYFKKVLRVYVREYKETKGIDPVNFIKERFNINDYFIPSYIFYLVDESDKERLHKVLMSDYRANFPSKRNLICRAIVNIILIFLIILIIVHLGGAIISFFTAATMSFLVGINMIFRISININKDIICSIFYCLCMGFAEVIYVFVSYKITEDDYTLMIKQMDKKIRAKVKYFDKKSIVWRLFNRGDDYYIN